MAGPHHLDTVAKCPSAGFACVVRKGLPAILHALDGGETLIEIV
jgi:hypothetical protein